MSKENIGVIGLDAKAAKAMALGLVDAGAPTAAVRSPRCVGKALHPALKPGNFGGTDFLAQAFARLAAPA